MSWWDWLTPVAYAQDGGGAAPTGPNPLMMVLVFGGIGLVWWLMMIRPQQRREKDRKSMISSLRKGDTVVTAGGIHARVFAVDGDDVVTLELGRDVRFKLDKSAIVARLGDERASDGKSKDGKG